MSRHVNQERCSRGLWVCARKCRGTHNSLAMVSERSRLLPTSRANGSIITCVTPLADKERGEELLAREECWHQSQTRASRERLRARRRRSSAPDFDSSPRRLRAAAQTSPSRRTENDSKQITTDFGGKTALQLHSSQQNESRFCPARAATTNRSTRVASTNAQQRWRRSTCEYETR